ncbi:hypothetical protein BH708_02425 [Brachybacterium sp. P6-10-X1]|nr:hypothetical protein BH708_02425 [Brachybacterium sp. P6-10-X1]
MPHSFSVTVRATIDRGAIELVVTGCLTEDTQQELFPLIRRARMLGPVTPVTVDLTTADHIDSTALVHLRASIDHDDPDRERDRIQFLLPGILPACAKASDLVTGGTR